MRPVKRLPKSIAEYAMALSEARNEGASHALEILLFVLVDKYGWDADQLKTLMTRVGDQALAITEGYITPKDITKVLREEYGIQV